MKLRSSSRKMKAISIHWIKANMCKTLSFSQLKQIRKRGMNSEQDLYILIESFVNPIHARVPFNSKEYRVLKQKRTLITKLGGRRLLRNKKKVLKRNTELVRQALGTVIKLLQTAKYGGKSFE